MGRLEGIVVQVSQIFLGGFVAQVGYIFLGRVDG